MTFAITGWGVISPIGTGRDEFAAAVREGRSGVRPLAELGLPGPLPFREACIVPDFQVAKILGTRKGTRVLDRTAALAVGATTLAIRDSRIDASPAYEDRAGLALGTYNGSISRFIELLTETMTLAEPWMVSPEAFPNTVMNFAAGQCAIWHRLRAVNTTISGGRLACLLALRYAWRALRFGYADAMVAGSVEEMSRELAWGAHHALAGQGSVPPVGEGCGMFVIEDRACAEAAGRRAHAELLACQASFYQGDVEDAARALAACVRRALEEAGVAAEDVWAVSLRESGVRRLDAAEERGLGMAFGRSRPPKVVAIGRLLGEAFGASGAFQLAALLAAFADAGEEARGKVGLVTALSNSGGVGCALVRNA